MGLEVILDARERLPGMGAAVEDRRVPGLAEIKQIRRFEHGPKLGQSVARANGILACYGVTRR